jgi:hypothetical protein
MRSEDAEKYRSKTIFLAKKLKLQTKDGTGHFTRHGSIDDSQQVARCKFRLV